MRLYVNLAGCPTLVSISQIFYCHSESHLCFCTIANDWFKVISVNDKLADFILCELFGDGLYDLTDFETLPFDKSDFLEE